MKQEMFIRKTRINSKFDLLTVMDEIISEEIFFGSFENKHGSNGWKSASCSYSSV